jgi:hypothetical protein
LLSLCNSAHVMSCDIEFEGMHKEGVVPKFKALSWKDEGKHHMNTRLKCYIWSNLLCFVYLAIFLPAISIITRLWIIPTNWIYTHAVEWQWRPSASGLMSSQVGGHLIPFSYSYNCRLKSRNDSLSSFYSLGTFRMENSYNSCSVVVFMSVTANTWRILRHCPAKSMLVEPFHSNGRLCWH